MLIMKFINVHTHHKSNDNSTISILNCEPKSIDFSIPFSIGIHPWNINEEKIDPEINFIEQQLQLKNCFAIGECGLDKLCKTDYELQLTVFKKQVHLSEKYQKPLIIHCVKSFEEIFHLKKTLKPQQKWIIHGFNKNGQVALSLIKNGCYVSFGKALTTVTKLQKTFKEISLDAVFLETDSDEIDIISIYQKAASIKELKVEELTRKIHQNFNTIFIK